jgi:hypothetical protein
MTSEIRANVEMIESPSLTGRLPGYPIVSRHAQRKIRIVQGGEVTITRLIDLPLPDHTVKLIAELIHDDGARHGSLVYRERFGAEPKSIDWYLD